MDHQVNTLEGWSVSEWVVEADERVLTCTDPPQDWDLSPSLHTIHQQDPLTPPKSTRMLYVPPVIRNTNHFLFYFNQKDCIKFVELLV